jgi:hypothetical protein
VKVWRVETPNSSKALKETLAKGTAEGWEVFHIVGGSTANGMVHHYTVVFVREDG